MRFDDFGFACPIGDVIKKVRVWLILIFESELLHFNILTILLLVVITVPR